MAAEVFVQTWARQFNGVAVILRPSNVYGPGQTARRGFGIVPTAFQCAVHGTPLVIWGNGDTIRDYLYIDDLMDLCMAAVVAQLSAGTHIFNAASGSGVSINQLIDQVDEVTGRPLIRQYQPSRIVDVNHVALDVSAARSAFDWQPASPLARGLRQTWGWFSRRG